MANGIFVNGARAKSKAAIKTALKAEPSSVVMENTSLFGGADGPLNLLPNGHWTFVGPDPYTSRKYYGSITVKDGKITLA